MSRIGKKPVSVPAGVTAAIEGKTLSVKGPKGTLSIALADEVTYAVEEGAISVQPSRRRKRSSAKSCRCPRVTASSGRANLAP